MNCIIHFDQDKLIFALDWSEIGSGMNEAINDHRKIIELIYNSSLRVEFGILGDEPQFMWVTDLGRF